MGFGAARSVLIIVVLHIVHAIIHLLYRPPVELLLLAIVLQHKPPVGLS
jgi:hypothetical protein